MGRACSKMINSPLQLRLSQEKYKLLSWSPKSDIYICINEEKLCVIQLPDRIQKVDKIIDSIVLTKFLPKKKQIAQQTKQIQNAILFKFAKNFLLIEIYFLQNCLSSTMPVSQGQKEQLTVDFRQNCKKLFRKLQLKNKTGLTLWQLHLTSQKYLYELTTCNNKYPELHDQEKRNLVQSIIVYKKALDRYKYIHSQLKQLYERSVKKLAENDLRLMIPAFPNLKIDNLWQYPQDFFGNQAIIKQVQQLLKIYKISISQKIVFIYLADEQSVKLFRRKDKFIYCNMYYGNKINSQLEFKYDPIINIEVDFFNGFNILNEEEFVQQFKKLQSIQNKKKKQASSPKKQSKINNIKNKSYKVCIDNISQETQRQYRDVMKKMAVAYSFKFKFVYQQESPDFSINFDQQSMTLSTVSQNYTFFNTSLNENLNFDILSKILTSYQNFKNQKKYKQTNENNKQNYPIKYMPNKNPPPIIKKQIIKQTNIHQQLLNKNTIKQEGQSQNRKMIFPYQIKCFPEDCSQANIVKAQIYKIVDIKPKPGQFIALVILKNMHDRGGLDLFDSQINYKFEQFKQIISSGPALIINLSPKCYLVSKVLKEHIIKKMKIFGHEINQVSQKVQIMAVEYNILNKKINFNPKTQQEFIKKIKKLSIPA